MPPEPTPPTPPAPTPPAPAPDPASEIAALKAELAALKKAAPPTPPSPDDPDIREKLRIEREKKEGEAGRSKRLESALRFSLGAPTFIKENGALLPKEAGDIFTQADKENYADAIEKDSAIKSNLVQSFFSVQANVDLLTGAQKAALDDYLKLTKNEKQARAQVTYDMIFEPAFETLKKVKRAEALSKGHGGATDLDTAYKNKLIAGSKKHYLGEKSNGA